MLARAMRERDCILDESKEFREHDRILTTVQECKLSRIETMCIVRSVTLFAKPKIGGPVDGLRTLWSTNFARGLVPYAPRQVPITVDGQASGRAVRMPSESHGRSDGEAIPSTRDQTRAGCASRKEVRPLLCLALASQFILQDAAYKATARTVARSAQPAPSESSYGRCARPR